MGTRSLYSTASSRSSAWGGAAHFVSEVLSLHVRARRRRSHHLKDPGWKNGETMHVYNLLFCIFIFSKGFNTTKSQEAVLKGK